jgi:SPP1 gp7 family putative phage head morphogenesis protein
MPKQKNVKVLNAVRPNAGIQAEYQRRLDRLITEMQKSLVRWLIAGYRQNEPEVMALDRSPAHELDAIMARLARKWQAKFDQMAPELADWFATATSDRSDRALQGILRKGGFSVRFKMTRAMNDAIQATRLQNVTLIKSIAEQHLNEVSGLVQRSVAAGRDIGFLSKQLEERYGITRRRATTIARSQNNLASATMTKVRYQEAGIKTAIWKHSHAGKTPRKSHEDFDGKEFEIAKGAYIDGEWIQPGEKINCRCYPRAMIPAIVRRAAA